MEVHHKFRQTTKVKKFTIGIQHDGRYSTIELTLSNVKQLRNLLNDFIVKNKKSRGKK